MYGLLRSEDAWSPALIWSQNKLYGSNTVDHAMSGKAFARAVCGHVIVQEQDNNNNNKHDNVYGAVIMAEPLREFTRFI